MAIFKLVEGLTYAANAASDLSDKVNYAAKIDASGLIALTTTDDKALGTIFEAADLGYPATVQFGGICKAIASLAMLPGVRVQSATVGKVKTGSTNPMGVSVNNGAADLSVISVAM